MASVSVFNKLQNHISSHCLSKPTMRTFLLNDIETLLPFFVNLEGFIIYTVVGYLKG